MKINQFPYALLDIFEKELGSHQKIRFRHSQNVKFDHVRLILDEDIKYYAERICKLFISSPRGYNYEILVNWQLLETYRIVNTAWSSALVSDSAKQKLLILKEELEKTPYLKSLLAAIDEGKLSPNLVCSGHGTYYMEDGVVNLEKFDSTVVFVSGTGATLANQLARDLENDQYDPNEVVVVHKDNETVPVEGIYPYPRFYNNQTPVKEIPDLCLINADDAFPKPRVIEPLTGRVLFDIKTANTTKNYFSLSAVLERFNGSRRLISWGACTTVRDDEGNKTGEFKGYRWTNKTDVNRKRKKMDEENDSNRRVKGLKEEVEDALPPEYSNCI